MFSKEKYPIKQMKSGLIFEGGPIFEIMVMASSFHSWNESWCVNEDLALTIHGPHWSCDWEHTVLYMDHIGHVTGSILYYTWTTLVM